MQVKNLFKISQKERNDFCTHIIDTSAPSVDFYFLIILSTIIVALGLLIDNVILVIGGMLVTPILSPILAIALGLATKDPKVIIRSMKIFFASFLLVFITAFLVGVFSSINISGVDLIHIMQPNLLTFFIALIAGLAASYTWAKPALNERLPGVAITVTLIPPLTVIGLAASHAEWSILETSTKTFFLNFFAIIIASLVIFFLMEFYKAKRKLEQEVKNEEKEIKNGKKK
jgi:uncharacterized hydrophobic protein (TIGR00271 family)